ncbi:MAG: glutamate dehydrogenase [Myxococcota bacterium]|jgi:glutamate dehydrogenase
MKSHLDRAELISRLLAEIASGGASNADGEQLQTFARAVVRRVDDAYLFRHRLHTLGAQLVDSFRWVVDSVGVRGVKTRAFHPTDEARGYGLEGFVIETVMPDQPFIYDTLKVFMEQARIRVLNSLHIIIPATVTEDGVVRSFNPPAETGEHFSYTRWYVDWPDASDAKVIAAEIHDRLVLAQQMVQDFHRMNLDVKSLANEFDYLSTLGAEAEPCTEIAEFLRWLISENFVFMGVSNYTSDQSGAYRVVQSKGLGSVRGVAEPSGTDTAETLAFLSTSVGLQRPLGRVRKSVADSVLHRRGKVDEIIVRTFDQAGKSNGGIVLHGMFTFKGLGEPGAEIPILRRKLATILSEEETVLSSYEHKSLVHAFNALPVEFLFEADQPLIRDLVRMTASAEYNHQIKTHIATQPGARSAYVFVVLPKENYSDELRALLQSTLQAELKASYADHRLHLGKYGAVALHFYLTGDMPFDVSKLDAVQAKLIEIGTPWVLRLRDTLIETHGEAHGTELLAIYAEAFSEGYIEATSVEEAVSDIAHLERVIETGRVGFDIMPSRTGDNDALLRIYDNRGLLLTDILPVVDNFGVVVVEQYAFDITPEHAAGTLSVNTLRIRRGEPDLYDQREQLVAALAAVFERKMRSDRINRILLPAGIGWKDVDLFRAYFNYGRQLRSQLTIEIVQKVLINHATFTHDLTALFHARFDPSRTDATRAKETARHTLKLNAYLKGVTGFEEDRILRLFFNLLTATVRTSFYKRLPMHRLSLKIDCAQVSEMPEPRPMFEIYVHHAEVEGVHLRGGRVARGGLRWSDRPDDYRSEVLGLMATQMLKNTLIVPVGAKGGFVLKTPAEDYAEARVQADTLYKVFIRGLLDLTDNIVDGNIVPPTDVVRYDEPDPYLVVAADKGTAHLSDTANALSAEYRFWLQDAFASGGSIGYDHKEKGITAKGAWVCVRRHFLEMGIDPERDVITAAGIGDMSGDVFGNGLLSSQTIQLIAAFDHRHIFLDPTPDPAASFAERKRLFEVGRSSWKDYDASIISEGGGVFARDAKAIPLSAALRTRFGVEETEVSGNALMQLILEADVDLLWNGGIGTYVKASTETHADVGDPSNDRVRVDANALHCRVIGEGGNLGMTMRARVEFAALGGRVNLDAIDNSGGVDLSDHEVNLKTLLGPEVTAGRLLPNDRDRLLIAVGDGICDDVLANNDSQCRALSLDEMRSKRDIWAMVHAMLFLRSELGFSRRFQRLPRGVTLIESRLTRDEGFFRPELAKLLSFSKMFAHKGLEQQPIGSKDELRPFLLDYFPAPVIADHADAVDSHILFNEIAATVQVNRVVDMAGVTFFPTLQIATERATSDICAAYLVTDDLLQTSALRDAIGAANDLPLEVQYQALIEVEDHLVRASRALLWTHPETVSLATSKTLVAMKPVLKLMANGGFESTLPDTLRRDIRHSSHDWTTLGASPALAAELAMLAWRDQAFFIAQVSLQAGIGAAEAATHYYGAGFATRVLDLCRVIDRQSFPDRWDNVAVPTIVRALFAGVVRLAVLAAERGTTPDALLGDVGLEEIPGQIDELTRERIPVSAMLVLSERIKYRLDRATSA